MRSRLLEDLERLLCLGLRDDARRTGLSESTARVLLALEPGRDLPMGDLAVRLGRSRSTATRFVDRAVAEGLLERLTGRDRRRRLARLTPAGVTARESLAALRAQRAAALPRAVRARTGLGEGEVEWFVDAVVAALLDRAPIV